MTFLNSMIEIFVNGVVVNEKLFLSVVTLHLVLKIKILIILLLLIVWILVEKYLINFEVSMRL